MPTTGRSCIQPAKIDFTLANQGEFKSSFRLNREEQSEKGYIWVGTWRGSYVDVTIAADGPVVADLPREGSGLTLNHELGALSGSAVARRHCRRQPVWRLAAIEACLRLSLDEGQILNRIYRSVVNRASRIVSSGGDSRFRPLRIVAGQMVPMGEGSERESELE